MSETRGSSPTGIERRRATRVPADFAIRIAERDEGAAAQLRDLSTNGLCCTMARAVNEMTLVRIDLEIPGGNVADGDAADGDAVHTVTGAVVRCAKLRGQTPPTYEVAVYFTELEPETRAVIDRYVRAHEA